MQLLRIAIYCPIGYVTGGPEALHQLCDELRNQGQDARLVPTVFFGEPAIEYKVYDAPIASFEFAKSADVIITPENYINLDSNLSDYPQGQIFIWWLSVDNCLEPIANSYETKKHPIELRRMVTLGDRLRLKKSAVKTFLRSLVYKSNTSRQAISNSTFKLDFNSVSHMAQSYYAQDFVSKELGKPAPVVSDYIRREKIGYAHRDTVHSKKVVAYNFAKSHLLLSKTRKRLSAEIDFIPLVNMSSMQIRDQLIRSDLYLDLGHFPGRDRLPREAISMDCPVLLARRGAARYREDFQLEEEFRFDIVNRSSKELAYKIQELLVNKQEVLDRQRAFKDSVCEDKKNFRREVAGFLEILHLRNRNWH